MISDAFLFFIIVFFITIFIYAISGRKKSLFKHDIFSPKSECIFVNVIFIILFIIPIVFGLSCMGILQKYLPGKKYWIEINCFVDFEGKDLIINEEWIFHLKGNFHEIFRYVDIPSKTITPYSKVYATSYYIDPNSIQVSCSKGKVKIKKGSYQTYFSCTGNFEDESIVLSMNYIIRNGLSVYNSSYVIFHKLFDNLPVFSKVNYYIAKKEGYALHSIYTHPPVLTKATICKENCFYKNKTYFVKVTADLPKDTFFEIRALLYNALTNRGIENDIAKKIRMKELFYEIKYIVLLLLSIFFFIMYYYLLLKSYFIWLGKGKEIEIHGIPKYISFPPKRRKPWIVNMLFVGDPKEIDSNGLAATLLELKRKGKIDIIVEKEKFLWFTRKRYKIKVIDKTLGDLDNYERAVLLFLIKYSDKNYIFDIEKIKEEASSDASFAYDYLEDLNDLKKGDLYINRRLFNSIYREEGQKELIYDVFMKVGIIIITLLMIVLITPKSSSTPYFTKPPIYNPFASLCTMLLITYLMLLGILFGISKFFGRYTREGLKERLLWQSFRRFLTNTTRFKKFILEHMEVWEDYLTYAVALGVAERVIKILSKLGIEDIESKIEAYNAVVYVGSSSIYSVSPPSSRGGGGGWSGGLGGVGGGIGGGGGGAR